MSWPWCEVLCLMLFLCYAGICDTMSFVDRIQVFATGKNIQRTS